MAGSSAEDAFDRLTALAATLLDAPIAFVTVVDGERSSYNRGGGRPDGGDRFGAVEESLYRYVVARGKRLIVEDAATDERTQDNPAIKSAGVAAWAGFPLFSPAGQVLGTFCAVDTVTRQWSGRDLGILETLAQAAGAEISLRAALADAEAAREQAQAKAAEAAELSELLRVTGERSATLARTLQASLLPPELPDVPGMEVAALYVPASTGEEVVGDFYDVFEGAQGTWCVVVGDVMGKGPAAASVAASARYTLRAVALRTTSPNKALSRLNEALLHQHQGDARHLTVAFATLRWRQGRLVASVVAAGHPLPILRRADGTVSAATEPGMALGWFDRPSLIETRVELKPGDSLVFVTDGVTEARRSGEEFGDRRLSQAVARCGGSPDEIAAAVMAEVASFRNEPPKDDTAVLAVRAVP